MQHDFHYISKHDPKVREAYKDIPAILREAQDLLRSKFTFGFDVVGNYKRNMITYDSKSNVGYDFDFNIEVNDDDEAYKPKQLKNMLQKAIGAVCVKDDDFDLSAALEKAVFVERGDFWTVGRHRLVCRDATGAEDIAARMDGKKANLDWYKAVYMPVVTEKDEGGVA